MKMVMAVIVGAGWAYGVAIEDNKTVGHLKARLREWEKGYSCHLDEMTLYLAKKNGRFLNWYGADVQRVLEGEIPDRVKPLLTEEKKLDPERLLSDFDFPEKESRPRDKLGVLIVYPEAVTRRFRKRRDSYRTQPTGTKEGIACCFSGALASNNRRV
jgi:hypothetical protein